MKNFRKINREEYKNLIDKVLFSTFFHGVEWHEFLEKEFKWLKFEYYSYKNEAILPLVRFKVFGKEKLISLPFCEYGGPLPLKQGIKFEEFEKDTLSEFGENIKKKSDFLKIKFHPEILKYFDKQQITKNIQDCNVFTSWIENLKNTNTEQLLASFRKTLRYEIRDAQQKDLLIKKCENLKELKQFYNLYVANLKRKKTIPYPFSIFEFLHHDPDTEIILAFFKDGVIGGNLFVNYGKFIHYFFSASDYNYKDFGVSCLLLWSKMKNLIGQDKILDLGATPKDSSLDVFKRGWGGKEYPILQLGIKKNSEGLRASKLRIIWGLLPNFLVKKLSQNLIKYRL
jgi:hypothetical protein